MIPVLRKTCFAFVVLPALFSPAIAATLTLTTEENPPYNFTQDGKVTGISTEILESLMAKTETPFTIEVLPWKRAYQAALEQADTCVFSTNRTAERESLFTWVSPIINGGFAFFVKPDSPLQATSVAELKGKVVGVQAGSAFEKFLTEAGLGVVTFHDMALMPKTLDAGRVELIADGKQTAPFRIKKEGLPQARLLFVEKETTLGLACNKGVAPDLIETLNQGLKAMHEDGTVKAIEQKYQ